MPLEVMSRRESYTTKRSLKHDQDEPVINIVTGGSFAGDRLLSSGQLPSGRIKEVQHGESFELLEKKVKKDC